MIRLTDILNEGQRPTIAWFTKAGSGVEYIGIRGVPHGFRKEVMAALNSKGYSASLRSLTGMIQVLYVKKRGGDEKKIKKIIDKLVK